MPFSWAAVRQKVNEEQRGDVVSVAATHRPAAKNASAVNTTSDLQAKLKKARWSRNPLLFLDYNIRLLVLNLVIDPIDKPLYLLDRRNGRPKPFPVPAIARAFDNQNRLECLMILPEKSTLELHHKNARLHRFLQSLDFNDIGGKDMSYERGHDCVRALSFPLFSDLPCDLVPEQTPNNDITLISLCKNLNMVSIAFNHDALVIDDGKDVKPKPIKRLRREYRLDDMLVFKKLARLEIRLRYTTAQWMVGEDLGGDQIQALRMWFREAFEECGKTVVEIG